MDSIHVDFKRILTDFLSLFGEAGRRKYDDFIKQYSLDATKSYASQLTRECLNGICESFQWATPLIQYLKKDEEAKYYKVRALTATLSMNANDYSDLEEIERSARTLTWRPLNLNHDPRQMLPFPQNRVDWAEYEDLAVEAIIRIDNEQADIQDKLDNGDIVNPSIEGEPRGGYRTEDGRNVPKWYNFTCLALLEKNASLPGVPTTIGFEPLFLNEALGHSLVESLSMEQEKEKNTMSNQEEVELEEATEYILAEARWTRAYINDLPDGSFAVVEPCADTRKDARHLPYKDAAGKIDLPHLRNALARMDQIISVCNGSDEALRRKARAELIPLAKRLLPNSKWAQEKTVQEALAEKGIQGMDVCGQCKFFTDLENVTTEAPAAPGSDAIVTHTAGAIGPGIGNCSVARRRVRKADSVCTDGRPRDQPTNLDRTIETMTEINLKSEIADLKNTVLQERQATNEERQKNIKTLQEMVEKDNKIASLTKDKSQNTSEIKRLKEERLRLREEGDRQKEDNTRLEVQVGSTEKDLSFYKDENKRINESIEATRHTIAETKEALTKALTKTNDESTKRAQAVQQAINAETDKARAIEELAISTAEVAARTRELSDFAMRLNEYAKKQITDGKTIDELRKKHGDLVEEYRKLKQDYNTLKDRKKIRVNVRT
ncbi:MAG TPA: hypothetical protein VMW50_03100 [Dehalococcoidia bacterium]|nr:hypothetical protein [Dehalococcoidia bacterium]